MSVPLDCGMPEELKKHTSECIYEGICKENSVGVRQLGGGNNPQLGQEPSNLLETGVEQEAEGGGGNSLVLP